MVKQSIKMMAFKYKKIDKRLKEQLINGTTDQIIIAEIIRELTVIKYMREITSQ